MKQWSANCGTSVSATCRSVTSSSSEPGQALADPLQQPDPVALARAGAPGGPAGDDHDPVDRAGGIAQRHGLRLDGDPGPVGPDRLVKVPSQAPPASTCRTSPAARPGDPAAAWPEPSRT